MKNNDKNILNESIFGSFFYQSKNPKMLQVYKLLEMIYDIDSPILITGEPGTGKGVIADLIHKNSKRSSNMFSNIDCEFYKENSLESELFGHTRGAFTCATNDTSKGRFEIANGGTVFLDNIHDLDSYTQTKILNALTNKEIIREGGRNTIRIDIRLITATYKDLTHLINEGKFRRDLYYRLNILNIKLPSLRERKEDIVAFAKYFEEKYSNEFSKTRNGFHPDTIDMIEHYSWPGNIRELENVIQRAIILRQENRLIMPDEIQISNDV